MVFKSEETGGGGEGVIWWFLFLVHTSTSNLFSVILFHVFIKNHFISTFLHIFA